MARVYQWLGVSAHKIDSNKLTVRAHESDSHFRHKYLHRRQARIATPKSHEIPVRVQELIKKACGWYYECFYPELVVTK
jgi:sulfotransferase